MLASVQREQDDLAEARRERGRRQQQQQEEQQQQTQHLLPPQPQLPPPPPPLPQQQQQQQVAIRLNLDPAFLAKCRGSRGPLLRAMIQEHTRRRLT